jgi:DNA-binding beta-propeller fold protein YncE
VFDVRNRSRPRIVRQVELPFPTVNWASFTHDGRAVVICGHPAGVTFADGKGFFAEVRVSNGRLVAAPTRTHNGAAVLVATAPSGDRVAGVGFGGSFELIDPVHRRVIAHYGGPGELIDGVAYSPDGSTIAVADFTGQLTFINAQTGRVERRVQLIAEPLATVAYSPDGRMIATVDTQDNTRLYDSATLRQIGTTYAPPWAQQPGPLSIGHASFAQFAPDGTRVYVSDEGAGVWAVPTSAALWEADVCRIANRPFTRAEWDQYVPGRSYQPGCP